MLVNGSLAVLPVSLLEIPASAAAGGLALGAVITVLGHLAGVRRVVVGGILVLFVATAMMIVGGYAAYQQSPDAAPDPLRGTDRIVPDNQSIGDLRRQFREQQKTSTVPDGSRP